MALSEAKANIYSAVIGAAVGLFGGLGATYLGIHYGAQMARKASLEEAERNDRFTAYSVLLSKIARDGEVLNNGYEAFLQADYQVMVCGSAEAYHIADEMLIFVKSNHGKTYPRYSENLGIFRTNFLNLARTERQDAFQASQKKP
jgi:hypothetical protein